MQQKPDIIFIIFYESIFQCTPWLNSIALFTKKGYNIKVYQRKFKKEKYNSEKGNLTFSLHEVKTHPLIILILRILQKTLSFIGRLSHIRKLSKTVDDLSSFYFSKSFIYSVKNHFLKEQNDSIIIVGDPVSLITANVIFNKYGNKFVYWNLELYVKSELISWYKIWLKNKEIDANKNAVFSIEFGPNRKKILAKENGLDKSNILLIPNSPIGNAKIKRNYFFNEKFDIPRDKIIILNAGGLASYNNIPELLRFIVSMPDNVALVLHSKVKIKAKAKKRIFNLIHSKNIFINDDPLPFSEIDTIYSSCDIGLVLMSPTSSSPEFYTNLLYVDWSSGKMFNYFKFGKPIITFPLPGYKKLIEDKNAGVCISDFNMLFSSIDKIVKEYSVYQKGSLNLYEILKFEKYHSKFEQRIYLNI